MRLRRWLVIGPLLLLVFAALAFRLAAVDSFSASAGDGVQYYQLAQQLRLSGRLAFAPPPAPLSFSRLPGYPLFLAWLVDSRLPLTLAQHLHAATRWNAWLDVGTALLVLSLLRQVGRGLVAAVAGFVAVCSCPLLIYLSMYGLCESLVTFLFTLELLLLSRFAAAGRRRWALLAGGVAGLGQLCRVDALTLWPVALLLLLAPPLSWPLRRRGLLLYGLALGLVFAPWPLRNLARFGAAHPGGTPWAAQSGAPLPGGMQRWFRSWSAGLPGQGYLLLPIAYGMPLDIQRPGILQPAMYDDDAERQQVLALFDRYNHERLTPAVDAGFISLATARLRRAPLRTLVTLPLHRLRALWAPIPDYELPVQSALLRLPAKRAWLASWQRRLLWLACGGGLLLAWRPGAGRRLVAAVALLAAGRSLLFAYIHAFPVERYLAEVYPGLLLLAGVAVATPPVWLCRLAQVALLRARVRPTAT